MQRTGYCTYTAVRILEKQFLEREKFQFQRQAQREQQISQPTITQLHNKIIFVSYDFFILALFLLLDMITKNN